MKTDELREKYLAFFESKGCVRRPSDVLVPKEDRTVLFTPAGMNQFKNQFLGVGPLDFTRATTCQKCLRTGDIGNVGVTAYHHTFFEMLGNFSFGDYFKKDAIHWAWEFLTDKKWLGLEGEKLSVTVYLDDDEAYNIWHDEIKVPTNRLRRDDEHENFWPAGAPSDGPDGVCGPCSEIFYHPAGGSKDVEIWNLVFTQFNRVGKPPNNLRPLPKKNIDTGMGLERTAAVLQGVRSNFEIDTLRGLCETAGEVVGVKYDFDGASGRALRRIADHLRACAFAVHEGVAPGSNAAPYIIRLLLRRAFLEGYLLGKREPFLHELVPAVIDAMQAAYPDLAQTQTGVMNTIRGEETQFLDTIDRGLSKFEKLAAKTPTGGVLPGRDVFDLHQTDGFVVDLTEALAADRGLTIDKNGFKQAEDQHRVKSGQGSWGVMAAGPLDSIRKDAGDTEFQGYEATTCTAKVVGIVAGGACVESIIDGETLVDVVLDRSPFYGESGGQVGDLGTITSTSGAEFQVLDTQKHAGILVHRGKLVSGTLAVGGEVTAEVTHDRRAGIRRAHSATHLLHHALHRVLGKHAVQRGSKVENDMFRFDFSHGAGVTSDELVTIEDIINDRIAEGAAVGIDYMSIEEAKSSGAMALFGEKYPDTVRVVSMGDYSKELCGGTHLENTGQVGLCRVVNEENVAAGVRRITALTGQRALQRIRDTEGLIGELVKLLKTQPEELCKRVAAMQTELRDVKQKLAEAGKLSIGSIVDDLLGSAEMVGDVKVIAHLAEGCGRDELRELADQLRSKGGLVALVVGAEIDGKVALTAAVSKELISRGLSAANCVRAAAKIAGGGGGGRPDLAEAGAKFPEKLPEALAAGATYYREAIQGAASTED